MVGYFSLKRSLQDGGIYQTKAHDREFSQGCQGLLDLEAIPADQFSPRQTAHYTYLKEKLRVFEEIWLRVTAIALGVSPSRNNAKLQQRSGHNTVIGELRHRDGDVYSDNHTLLNIVTTSTPIFILLPQWTSRYKRSFGAMLPVP